MILFTAISVIIILFICIQFDKGATVTSIPEPPRKRLKMSCREHGVHSRTRIDVDQHIPRCQVNTWITNQNFTLLREDQQVLLHPTGWLTASIIAAAQSLLKEQHRGVGGLQDPCLAQTMGYKKEEGEFVQIVHNGFQHWLVVTNIGSDCSDAEVMIYDSLCPSIGTFVQKHIAALLCTHHSKIKVNIINMQVQSGNCDCGLFAIATATSLL